MASFDASGKAIDDAIPKAGPTRRGESPRLVGRVVAAGVVQAFTVGFVLHRLHDSPNEAHEAVYVTPVVHWLRDSALAAPWGVLLLLAATLVARRVVTRHPTRAQGIVGAYLLWAALGALAYATASVPAALLHARLFSAHHEGSVFLLHSAEEAVLTLRFSFALLLAVAALGGLPWNQRSMRSEHR